MKPPLIVNEHGDISIYSDVDVMLCSLESIDVENGEYQVFDSEGRKVELSATAEKVLFGLLIGDGKIGISKVEDEPTHADLLKKLLVAAILSQRAAVDAELSLEELIKVASNFDGQSVE